MYAYDISDDARRRCDGIARANGVRSGGRCVPGATIWFSTELPLDGAFAVQCKGYELELLDPVKVPLLRRCDMLIELHDCVDPRIKPTLLDRLSSSHRITIIGSAPRTPEKYPLVSYLGEADRLLAVDAPVAGHGVGLVGSNLNPLGRTLNNRRLLMHSTVVMLLHFVPNQRRTLEEFLLALTASLRERGWRTVFVFAGAPGDEFRDRLGELGAAYHLTRFPLRAEETTVLTAALNRTGLWP